MKSNDLRFSTKKEINYEGEKATIYVNIRLNDECKNGHQDFAITGDIYRGSGKSDRSPITGGCIHEEILKYFPEFKMFVDLHLCDFSGAPTYALENGFYHLKNSSEETAKGYLRLTDKEFRELKKAKDSFYFSFLIHQMEIPKRWKKEANKAIKKLEELTGKEFLNDSTKSQLNTISEEKIEEIKEKVGSGYYSDEAIQEREIEKKEAAKKAEKKKIITEATKKIMKIRFKKDLMLYLINKDIPTDNVIYYDHTNTLKFNWLDYQEGITEAQFDKICEGFDLEAWNGITLVLEGVKQYAPITKE